MNRDQQREKTISGARYRVMMLDPEQAEDCFFDILRIVGPTLAGMIKSMQGAGIKGLQQLFDKKAESAEFVDMAVGVLRDLSSGFDKVTYHEVSRRLAEVTSVSLNGGKTWPRLTEVQTELFRGKLQDKWAWLGFALETNFAGFFGAISNAAAPVIGAAMAKAASNSISPPASDGASGES